MYQWTIDLWKNPNGVCYVEVELLKNLDSVHLQRLFKKMDTYTKYPLERLRKADDLESLGGDIHELKFHIGIEIRYLGCISYGSNMPVFHALCGFVKKTRKIKSRFFDTTHSRLIEFKKSYGL